MMRSAACYSLALASLCLHSTGADRIDAVDSNIRYEGRIQLADGGVSFDHPGVRVTLTVTDTSEVAVLLSAIVVLPNRFWVYVDGVLSDKIIDTRDMPSNAETEFLLASDLDKSVSHTVTLVKITEAQYNALVPEPNYITVNGFILDDGARTVPCKNDLPTRKIEFIGDSITAGYCDLCDSVDPALGDVAKESFATSHAALTCSYLNATCHNAAWSGYGVSRNCCGGDTLMPEIYTRRLASVPGSVWDFAEWSPDAVVINLGTNDHLDPNDPDGDAQVLFVNEYVEFLRNITEHYASFDVEIFAACGPMTTSYCQYVQDAVLILEEDNINVNLITYDLLSEDVQCCGHPSNAAQADMASYLSKQVASIMNWY